MPNPTQPLLTATLTLAVAALPATAGDSRELAARLRAETAWAAEAHSINASYAPQPMTASVLLQTRYALNFANDGRPGEESRRTTAGFSQPRAQIRLDANIANQQLLAHVMFDFGDAESRRGRGRGNRVPGPGEGVADLREAWVQYNFTGEQTGYYLKAGQFRSLVLYEEALRPEHQLAVDRSLTNEFFGTGNTQGIALGFVGPKVAWDVSFNDGIAFRGRRETANTSFNDPLEADYAVSSRVDIKLAGDWSRFEDFTSWRGEDVAARVGFGFHWERHGDTNPNSSVPDFLFGDATDGTNIIWTVDASYESDGWHAFLAYTGTRVEWEYDLSTLIFVHHGLVAQAGMFATDDLEVFARFDAVNLDGTLVEGFGGTEKLYKFLTVGMNWYITPMSHAAKFTFDVTAALDNSDVLDDGVNNALFFPDPSVTGLLGATSEEWVLRAQLQLLF